LTAGSPDASGKDTTHTKGVEYYKALDETLERKMFDEKIRNAARENRKTGMMCRSVDAYVRRKGRPRVEILRWRGGGGGMARVARPRQK